MSILNKYFLRQLLIIFVMLLMVLTGLAWMVQIMSMMKFVMNYGVAMSSFIGLTALMIPFIVSIIIPFVTFIATIFVYNKLISDNEVTVMVSSTLSPWQIARPAVMLAGVLTAVHLCLNLFVVPSTQSRFYDTQWNLRYGLAHMKLQEGAFTEMSHGLVVYVDQVSGHDLAQVMLSDTRNKNSEITIFAEKGKLVSTARGLSIVMSNGSLHAAGDAITMGTFDNFEMDLNVADSGGDASFRVRRMATHDLIKSLDDASADKRRKIMNELTTRTLSPFMNLILTLICVTILLRSSLLRRRASFAPAVAVLVMAIVMAVFMSATNMIATPQDWVILALSQFVLLALLLVVLCKK